MGSDPPSLVNAVLAQSATAQRTNALIENLTVRVDRMTLMLQPLLNTAEELNQTYVHELRSELRQIRERLAVLSKDVSDVEREVTDARIDTSKHQLAPPEHERIGILKLFVHADWFTKILLTLIFLAAIVSLGAHAFK